MRTKNVLYSLITTFSYQIITAITNFISIKLFIAYFGSEMNGLTSSIVQLINYINVVEAGLALTAIQSLYKPLREKKWKDINSILSATDRFYKISGSIFVVILILVSTVYPNIIDSSIESNTVTILILVMAGGSIIEYFLNGKMRVLLVADQKSYILNLFQIVAIGISFILKVYLIVNGYSVIIVQSISTIAILIRVVLAKVYIKSKYKYVDYSVKPNDSALDNRWSVLIHQIAGLIVFNSPIILISIFCSLEEASVYAVYNFVFGSLVTVTQLFSKSVVPSFGNILSEGDKEKVKKVFYLYQTMYLAFATILYTVTYKVIEPFIILYTKGINDIDYNRPLLIYMFIMIGILNSYRVPSNTLIEGSGHYKQTKWRALLEAIINISVSLIMVKKIGIYGVLAGTITALLYRSIDIIIYTHKYILNDSLTKTVRTIFINIVFIVIIVLFTENKIYIDLSWINWILYSFVTTVIVSIVVVIVNSVIYKGLIKEIYSRFNRVF